MKTEIDDEIVAAMQADRDEGMTWAKIAQKYGVSCTAVQYRVKDKERPVVIEKKQIRASFAKEWNEARCRILGLPLGWIDEWNAARASILAVKK